MKKDFQSKKLTRSEEELLKRILSYFDDRMLNLVAQFRGLAIAAKVSPEDFFKAFTDDAAQDDFFKRLHEAEDAYNQNELQKAKTERAQSGGLGQPQRTASQKRTKRRV